MHHNILFYGIVLCQLKKTFEINHRQGLMFAYLCSTWGKSISNWKH